MRVITALLPLSVFLLLSSATFAAGSRNGAQQWVRDRNAPCGLNTVADDISLDTLLKSQVVHAEGI
jgi:hypothetical protein